MLALVKGGFVSGLTGTTVRLRVVDEAGTVSTQATFSAISYLVTDQETYEQGTTTALTVSAVMFNSLQLTGWTEDAQGYNFKATIPAAEFSWSPETYPHRPPPSARRPHLYRIDFKFTPATGEPLVVPVDLWVVPVWLGN